MTERHANSMMIAGSKGLAVRAVASKLPTAKGLPVIRPRS